MWKNVLLVFLGACSFGILSTFVKIAYSEGYTVGEVTGAQVFFGMSVLWIIYGAGKALGFFSKSKEKKEPFWKLMLSGLSTGSVSILYYMCVELIPASIAIILLMQFIWMSVLIEFIVFKERPSRLQILSVLLVLGGTTLAAGIFNQQAFTLSFKGIIFGLLAAFAYAIFLIVNGRVGNNYPAVQKSAFMLTGACILVFIVFPPTFLYSGVLGQGLWFWGILLSLFGTVLPPLFYAIGIPKVGIPLSSILSAVELPVAVGMSYFLLSEKVSGLQWLGVVIILLAIIWPNWLKMKGVRR